MIASHAPMPSPLPRRCARRSISGPASTASPWIVASSGAIPCRSSSATSAPMPSSPMSLAGRLAGIRRLLGHA